MTRPTLDPVSIMAALKAAGRDKCILCGRKPYKVGIWTPTPEYSRRLGAPPGKTRLATYCVCRKCFRRPDAGTAVEDKILSDVGDGRRN